ncbi:cytochrome P450 [soil metagenome]
MTSRDTAAPRLPWNAANPYPYYERHRADGDVVWDDVAGAWLILGYHAAKSILVGEGWTSVPPPSPAFDADLMRHNMLTTDGANHGRLRHGVRDVFSRSFVTGLEEGIEAIAAQTIDGVPAHAPFDFMAEIALPFPLTVASAWLGLEPDSARLLRDESPAISRMLSDAADPAAVQGGTAAVATLLTDLLPLAADRRRYPGDDLLSYIAADPDLELEDVVTTAVVIAVAGHETTANLLGAAIIRLAARPSETVDDRLVTELLRLDGPVQAVGRTATRDQLIDGVAIADGDPALVVLAAANRDPAVFEHPEEFQTDRQGSAPLTFGHGAHYCLGAALARLEIRIALEHILVRKPTLRGSPIWRDTPAIRGPQTLSMVFATP